MKMRDLELRCLAALASNRSGLRCGVLGEQMMKGTGRIVRGSAPFARLAGKVVKRLEEKGYVKQVSSKRWDSWQITESGRKHLDDSILKPGDYVLASLYRDGDPCDPCCVGFYSGMNYNDRFMVKNWRGLQFRPTGFRRCEKITAEEGSELLDHFANYADIPGPSVWTVLEKIRKRDQRQCCHQRNTEP